MEHRIQSIRPFLGAQDFKLSRQFYTDLGFEEIPLPYNMSYFKSGNFGFYLQDAYVKDWIDNTMVFVEVADVDAYWKQLTALDLLQKYPTVKLTPIRKEHWGEECFLHDPSGILWHFGKFHNQS